MEGRIEQKKKEKRRKERRGDEKRENDRDETRRDDRDKIRGERRTGDERIGKVNFNCNILVLSWFARKVFIHLCLGRFNLLVRFADLFVEASFTNRKQKPCVLAYVFKARVVKYHNWYLNRHKIGRAHV